MEISLEHEKVRRIELFVRDANKRDGVIARIKRILRYNDDGTTCVYAESERAVTAEGIMHELIADALCGTRKWDMDRMPDFGGWIITQLRSKKFNLVRKQIRPMVSGGKSRDGADTDVLHDDQLIRPTVSLEEEIENRGFDPPGNGDHVRDYEEEDCIRELKRRLEVREIEYFVLEGVQDKKSNQEIASDLKIEVSEVVNAKKRIKRVIDDLLRQ